LYRSINLIFFLRISYFHGLIGENKKEKMSVGERKSGGQSRAYLGQPRWSFSPEERYNGDVGSSQGGRNHRDRGD